MKRLTRVGIAIACACGLLGATASAANATILMSATPVLTVDPATVGQTNMPGSIILANDTTPPQNVGEPAQVERIRLTPSCGAFVFPPCNSLEPGVITVNPNATGVAGTQCAGISFPFVITDNATGEILLDIPTNTFTLPTGTECRINFTYNVNKMPAIDSQPGEPGTQTDQILNVRFFHSQSFDPVEELGSDFTTINPAPAVTLPPPATGQRAAALKKCAKIKKKKAKKKCKRRANALPV